MLKINDVTRLYLGVQGENAARRIEIDVSDWLTQYPGGTVSIWSRRNGEKTDYRPANVDFDAEEKTICWIPSGVDTFYPGAGMCGIRLTVGSTIRKSRDIETFVTASGSTIPGTNGNAFDYERAGNKPMINSVELVGNRSFAELGMFDDEDMVSYGKAISAGKAAEELNKKLDRASMKNNLTTEEAGHPLDARQGRVLNETKVSKSSIANNLTTTEEGSVLDARQGKALDDKKVDIHTRESEGKFLQTDAEGNAVWGSPAGEATIRDAAEAWLTEHVSQGETLAVDDTLQLSGYAADSAVAGQKIKENNSAVNEVMADVVRVPYNPTFDVIGGSIGSSTGSNSPNTARARTQLFPVKPGRTYMVFLSGTTYSFLTFGWLYTSSSVSSASTKVNTVNGNKCLFKAGENEKYFRIAMYLTSDDTATLDEDDYAAIRAAMSVYELTDDTLTADGAPANAKETGEKITNLQNETDRITYKAFQTKTGEKTKNGLTLTSYGTRIRLNGTCTGATIIESVNLDDFDGFSSAFYSNLRQLPTVIGHRYLMTFRMVDGSITKGGTTYTKETASSTENLARAYLMKGDATGSSQYWMMAQVNGSAYMKATTNIVGTFFVYCYASTTYTNAVFDMYITDIDGEQAISQAITERTAKIDDRLKAIANNNVSALSLKAAGTMDEIKYAEFELGLISVPDVGEAIDLTEKSISNYNYFAVMDCSEGDTVSLNVTTVSSAKAYAFINASGNVIERSYANTASGEITAPEGTTKLLVQNSVSSNSGAYCIIGKRNKRKYEPVNSANYLNHIAIAPINGEKAEYNGISISTDGVLCKLNGTATDDVSFVLNDVGKISKYSGHSTPYRENTTAGSDLIAGHTYRIRMKFVDGTIVRNETEYTPDTLPGRSYFNFFNAYLFQPGNVTGIISGDTRYIEAEYDSGRTGCFDITVKSGITMNNAVISVWVEDLTLALQDGEVNESIPGYWNEEIDDTIQKTNKNIYEMDHYGTSMAWVTDCHWPKNNHHSPAIMKKVLENCNIQYFINGGDIIEGTNLESKEAAEAELQDCINAFRICRLKMITLFGNHDRNYDSAPPQELRITPNEHFNIVFKSFLPDKNITFLQDYRAFYWEDEKYRYLCVYFWANPSPEQKGTWMEEACNTDKQIIMMVHGIYFHLYEDTTRDVIHTWILEDFEQYKDKIRCIIQGHTHEDGLRYAWETVPIVILDCDKRVNNGWTGTINEQCLSFITIDDDAIKVVRCGRGKDMLITEGTEIFTGEQTQYDEE